MKKIYFGKREGNEKENFDNSWNYDDVYSKLWRKTSGSEGF